MADSSLQRQNQELELRVKQLERSMLVEASLEKVRALSLAMQESKELKLVVDKIFEQLVDLGIDVHIIHIGTEITDLDFRLWVSSHESQEYSDSLRLPIANNPLMTSAFNTMKEGLDFFVETFDKETKDQALTALFIHTEMGSTISTKRQAEMLASPGFHRSILFKKKVNAFLSIVNYNNDEFSDEDNEIFKRFGVAFEQAYTRFLDLQKAEEQAREAQIEAALERLRAKSIGMHKSDELADVMLLLNQELTSLGVDHSTTMFTQWDWNTYQNGSDIWMAAAGEQYLQKFNFPFSDHPISTQYLQARKNGIRFYTETYTKKEKNEYLRISVKEGDLGQIPKERLQYIFDAPGLSRTVENFENSSLMVQRWNTEEFSKDQLDIIRRAGMVFEQSYTRFLDLQKAETQAREAQIEASLERVRAATMAMHNSNEVGASVVKMFNELMSLGVEESARCGIGILSREHIQMELWTAAVNPDDEVQIHIGKLDMDLHPLLIQARNVWVNKQEMNFYHLKGNDLKKYYQMINDAKLYPHEFDLDALPPSTYHYDFTFSHGILYVFTRSPLSDELKKIFSRFASLFSQTYQRYQDLVRAEEQTREAEIQLALERVRAKTMAMHSSEELAETAHVLFEQLVQAGIIHERINIGIVNEDKGVIEFWVTEQGGKQINKKFEGSIKEPILLSKMYKAWKNDDSSQVLEIEGQQLKKWLKYLQDEIGIPFDPKLQQETRTQNSGFFSQGMIVVTNPIPLPEDQLKILERFAAVFEQTYTRFLDLQKAEKQAREAQIEAALERIRAQATGMRQSYDLLDIVVAMRKEFVSLGHEALHFWHMKWCPDKYEKAMTSGDGSRIGMSLELPRHMHGDIKVLADWEQSSEPTIVFPMNVEEAVAYVDKMISEGGFKMVDPNAPTHEDIKQLGGITFVMARTSHGEIGYSIPGVKNPPEADLTALRRFASVFDLAYRRFEDLLKAEIRAREAQVEASVERVRSEAMAMHQPSDFVKVTQILIREITDLGIEGVTGAAFLLVDENDIVTMWDISDPGNMGFTRDYKSTYDPKEFKMLGEFWRRWKKGENYFVIKYDLKKDKKGLEEWRLVDPENYKNLKRAIQQNKLKTQWNPYGCFSKGVLTLDMLAEPDKDTKNIVIKMAKTFDLAYQRFDDLQKAEQQARAAKKQASLDRIRAEIASMRNQSDLESITPLIWSELVALEVPFFRCGVFIINASKQEVQVYLSTPGGESIAAINFEFGSNKIVDDTVEYWKNQKIFREEWSREEFVNWSKNLLDQGLIPNVKSYQHNEEPPQNLHLQFIPFRQGMLYVGSDHYLGEEHMSIITDIATDFSIAFARYEDFINLEKAKYQTETAYGELKSTQSQLIHAEKMASLGELTAGIAHEIQNPLNFVNNFSDLNSELVEELKEAVAAGDNEEIIEILNDLKTNEEKIIHHGRRAEEIVRSMLQHSRGGDGRKEAVDINALADEYLRLSYHGLRAKDKSFNADFRCTLDKELPRLEVVPQDIGRVLLNLINNAFHAVSEKAGSTTNGYTPYVEVITRKCEDCVEIVVKDNGHGIPDKIKDKIFQPFFTTKATGSGTGLGLSLSFDIITKGHGGTLEVKSEKGEGSEFIVNLPLA